MSKSFIAIDGMLFYGVDIQPHTERTEPLKVWDKVHQVWRHVEKYHMLILAHTVTRAGMPSPDLSADTLLDCKTRVQWVRGTDVATEHWETFVDSYK